MGLKPTACCVGSMGLERVFWSETVRASMVSSTLGAAERPGRRRGGEESSGELGFWVGEFGSSSEYW